MREIMLLWQSKNFSERYKNIKGLIFLPQFLRKLLNASFMVTPVLEG